jgi:hypothetical protein
MIVTDIFFSNNQCVAQWLLEPGARASLASAQQAGRHLFNVLKNVLECDLTLPLYLSVLQHFGGDEDKFNIIDYFLCDQMYFENLSYSETVIENPKEKDPAKVITRVERYHVPNYLRARCIFFKKFLEDKKNNGNDLNYKSFYMGLRLDDFMAWKAEEMTMNTSSPHVAKSRDLVADFKKGIKRDPSLFPSLKHIDNWPTFKRETMAQAFAQDLVNVFNLKYKPRGSEEKDLFTLQLYYVYAIFCSNLKTDFDDAEKSTVAQLNATDLLQYTHTSGSPK